MSGLKWAAVVALVVMAGLAIERTYWAGWDAAMASIAKDLATAQRAAFEAADLASRKEAARLAAETERADLARQLETAADEDVDADRICLGADSVQRLKAR